MVYFVVVFPNKTWEKNWITLQKEINALHEILSVQLLNGHKWTSKLCTKLITKISVNLLNDLVIKLNLRPKIRTTGSPSTANRINQQMKLPSCDALHLFEFYPSQSNNNLFQNIEWLFPLDSKSGKKILINDHHVPNVELAAHLFMSAINCYNQNMLKKRYYPYQMPLNIKVIKGSEFDLSPSNGADFYCSVSMNVYDIENNKIFQQFQKEFIQTCRAKVYGTNIDGIKPHWRNFQVYKYMKMNYNDSENGIYSFIKYQYKDKLEQLNEIRKRDNKNPIIFQPLYMANLFM